MPKKTIAHSGDWLWGALKRARTGVTIVSPWLSLAPAERLLSSLPKDTSATVVFRWPRTVSDAWALDGRAVQALSDDERVTLEYVTDPLHSKLYLVDNRALVSSANFTSAGLGEGGRANDGNLELGVQGGRALHREVQEFINTLRTTHLNSHARKLLLEELSKLRPGGRQGFPEPPPSLPESRKQFAREVLEACRLRPLDAQLAGHRNVWQVAVGRGLHRMKVHTSVEGHGYHFEVSRTDDTALRKGALEGLLLLPCRKDGPAYATPDDAPSVIVLEKPCLYGRRGLSSSALKGHKHLSLTLERGSRGWSLHLAGSGAFAPLHAMRARGGRVLRLRKNVWTRVK